MRARAFEHLAVPLEQRIDFLRQRLDLGGEAPFEPRRLARADLRERAADAVERPQAETHLDEQRDEKPRAHRRHGGEDGAVEALDVGFHLRLVARHREGDRHVVARQHHPPLDHAELLVLRARRVEEARARNVALGVLPLREVDRLVEERARAQREPLRDGRDLPVPARIGEVEARLVEVARADDLVLRVDLGRRDQAAEQHVEPRVEGALDRMAEDRGEDEAARDERDRAPENRARDQPEGEAVGADAPVSKLHLPAPRAGSRGPAPSRSCPCRACAAAGRRRPRWCWSRGRNPGRRDAPRVPCAR